VSWVLAFAGFALLVILHELGHFAVAKAVGMRVEKFSLFFPPTLASKKVGETEYAIGLIPAGGYVRITGMNPAEDLPDEVRTRAYYAQPVWKRVVVIAAGPAMNLLLALLLLLVFFWVIGPSPAPTSRIANIEKHSPAASTLRPGDRIVSVDGVVGGPEGFYEEIGKHRCAGKRPVNGCRAAEPVKLVVTRDRRLVPVTVRPRYDAAAKRPRLGFSYALGPRETLPLGEAVTTSLDRFWFITKATASLPAQIFDSQKRKEISGIVGSYEVTRQTILNDVADVVGILAIISLSLALVNLFPFLPLDGGHIFWAVVERVRHKPVPFSVMERAGVVGFMLVIGLFMIGLTNDIGRLSGEGFQVR
jgi:regulator of sigma E protease